MHNSNVKDRKDAKPSGTIYVPAIVSAVPSSATNQVIGHMASAKIILLVLLDLTIILTTLYTMIMSQQVKSFVIFLKNVN